MKNKTKQICGVLSVLLLVASLCLGFYVLGTQNLPLGEGSFFFAMLGAAGASLLYRVSKAGEK